MTKHFVVGIAGGSGSGKTTLAERLLKGEHGSEITLLALDAYYLSQKNIPAQIRREENWDHPGSLDTELFVEHVDLLKTGHDVRQPVYNFTTHTREGTGDLVPSRRILLLEGILLFAIPEIRERIDLRIFVDTPSEERLIRRLTRDVRDRGRTVDSVVSQFRRTVRPMHDLYVTPSRVHADIVVPWDWGGNQEKAVKVINSHIGVEACAR